MRAAALIAASAAATAQALSLAEVCTTDNVYASLPYTVEMDHIIFNTSSITATVGNDSWSGETMFPDGSASYCQISFGYSHDGADDYFNVEYWFPDPSTWAHRFLATGGSGMAINGGTDSLPGGIMYGAAAGLTDGGFGGFDVDVDDINLLGNGTVNWDPIYQFGYLAIHEMTMIGKGVAANFYGESNSTKIYTYYQSCSEGGREGWSMAQRWGESYDGLIIGAPAIRYSQQQTIHLFSSVVEQNLDYYPPSCAFDKIVNETIAYCDGLDGLVDGVISRSDLCKLDFNLNSTLGKAYYCAASTESSLGFGFGAKVKRDSSSSSSTPEQNGTITAQDIAVVQTIWDGLFTSDGKMAYFTYQPGAEFEDGSTTWNNDTQEWEISIKATGGEWVTRFLQLMDVDNLSSLEGVTYDTIYAWMKQGMNLYGDSLQTNNPDLTTFYSNGGKILTFHGEQDDSIPTASSVRFHESVRSVMYPSVSYNESTDAMGDWYRLFIVPGAAHCATNDLQPNGPFPQTNMAVMIDWVENGIKPETLNATVLSGEYEGENRQICAWPLRPLWSGANSTMSCVYDQRSIDSWNYDLDAWLTPLY